MVCNQLIEIFKNIGVVGLREIRFKNRFNLTI